jgi:catechol 2,3-dioxygenase-like lactoylglutathione lyase family enzyme
MPKVSAHRTAAKVARKRPETLRLASISPSLTVNDLEKSIALYRDVLGFVVAEKWEDKGKLVGVLLKAGSATIMLGQDDFAKGRDRKKGEGLRIYCSTRQNVDELAAAIKSRGGRLDHEPTDQPWGTRDFAFTDPDGFKLTISSA